MGSCFSKKGSTEKASNAPNVVEKEEIIDIPQVEKKKIQEELMKKEIFVIKHRRSHEIERKNEEEKENAEAVVEGVKNGGVSCNVRTSSCTKEEVDAILIQCGRLSRSSSTEKAGFGGSGKKYCGSKRSFDFDSENGSDGREREENEDDVAGERANRPRHRNRSRTPSSPSQGRRRTPSREREQQARSGSRERGVNVNGNGNGTGRRVSRSPGRRSESPNTSSNGNGSSNSSRPQKMVSVPATVSSLAMDKSTNGEGGEGVSTAAVKRIQVRRNVGGGGDACGGGRRSPARTAASPRARSPAMNVQNQQQPITLSRSNSRKNEQSPFRRNPLSDIDTNVVLEKMPVPVFKTSSSNVMSQVSAQRLSTDCETKLSTNVNVVMSESLKPQGVGRSRSSRLSRDLDINPEALTNVNPSYTSLLLEDIQNFHQKSAGSVPAVTLPACVGKAHSIIEALADLNLSSAFSENKRKSPLEDNSFGKSQVVVADKDLMQPSYHKYVTVRRGTLEGGELEEEESSGSNSFVASSQQHFVPSSDSTDRWTSRSNKEDEFNPLGVQRQAISDDTRRRVVIKRKDGDLQQNGIGRGRIGPRGQYTTAAAASS